MLTEDRGAGQLGAHLCCAHRAETALRWVLFTKGPGALGEEEGGQEPGRECFTIRSLSSAPCWGGRARMSRVTKRQCGR